MTPMRALILYLLAVSAPVLACLAHALWWPRRDDKDEACRKIHDRYYKPQIDHHKMEKGLGSFRRGRRSF